MATLEQFAQLAAVSQDRFWGFLEITDIVNLSVCCHATSGLLVPRKTLNELIERHPRLRAVGPLKLSFPSDLSTGLLRLVLHRITKSVEAVIMIDDRKGRIVLDIGSALHDNESAAGNPRVGDRVNEEDDEEDEDNAQIFKQLEITSFDEYDDFNPRHPLPRDRAHRRGDSYFNSDIEMVVGEIGAMDLSSIARKALTAEDDDEDNQGSGAQTLRPLTGLSSGIAAADKPPLPPAQPKVSAKDRILSKTRNNIPGRPKVKTATAGDDDDDEDDN